MSILITSAPPNSGGGDGYEVAIIGDGTSQSFAFDFYNQIAADPTVSKKMPVGIFQNTASVTPAPAASLNGTTVEFTWSTPPKAGQFICMAVMLTFNA